MRLRWVTALVAGLVLGGLPGVASAEVEPCFDGRLPVTVEERRLDDAPTPGLPAVGPELVRVGGLADEVGRVVGELCAAPAGRAEQVVSAGGRALWRAAVERARRDTAWDSYDDRPLYWARLQLTRAVRQWAVALAPGKRERLVRRLDLAARGVADVGFRAPGRRVLVTGFDPFQLTGTSVRRSNPAGAAALRLDGRVIDTAAGKVVVEAAVLPVLWGAFDEGIVERVYGPAFAEQRPAAVVTISQGRPGRFDVERWAARWRGGSPDNNDVGARGPVPDARGWPQPALEFIETSLPVRKMVDAGTAPYPVHFNRSFCEWPVGTPGAGTPSCRTDEPTPGAAAAVGSGGDYLSNESMYRANRVRLGLGATGVLGGHLHTPVLGQPADPTALTDAAFEAERRRIVDQVTALVAVV
ncbi:hypothetical protein ABZ816_13515 [Actinosynnema sp. NPDC047251]|uniref:Secreted protein n=1 Tax=Saccharothrix espanaensis (strain ATCC 51144 / DSM 44229 / JCM 9112 / NBRC 15066 / NRRL 15764) TaxID=1179773 RepID=K0KFT6_SACES|nr:hypothetical protein [Saccharothrix espanaensis]CCH35614.1 hypothetical protein BN6_83990 [Saccharothrix espanaensis DSM 44229]